MLPPPEPITATAKLKDKVIFVTGAGSIAEGVGIGKACCILYAREGAAVVALDAQLPAAEDTALRIRSEGGKCLALAADVADPHALAAAIRRAEAEFGRIDGLHHNVGIGKMGGPTDFTLDEWQRIQAVNLNSLLNLTQLIVPGMQERKHGVILATSSIAGLRYSGFPHLAYGVSKAALMHFIKLIALQYATDGIRANSLVPGVIDTPRITITVAAQYANGIEEARADRAKQIPMRRLGTPWEVAKAALFLMSDDSSYVTGTELVVDGGITSKFI